ncbi:MAG TPA: polysaccharide deacetylase family protein [Opitutaceae bacterium]
MRPVLAVVLGSKLLAVLVCLRAPWTAAALWFGSEFLLAFHVFVPRAQGLGRVYRRFDTSRREVWLTIDDGPDPADTPRILALLARHGARATFFVIGRKAAAHPELVRAIVAAGHEVGHHTQTHPLKTFWCAPPARVRRELDQACAVLRAAGVAPRWFRPPAGHKSPWLHPALAARRLPCVAWTARGLERSGLDVEGVAARLTRRVRPGAILLLHEGPRVPAPIRVAAIARVLEHLSAEGYTCVLPEPEQLR